MEQNMPKVNEEISLAIKEVKTKNIEYRMSQILPLLGNCLKSMLPLVACP